VAARGVPGVGALIDQACSRSDHLNPSLWTLSVGYRYQPSSRHYIGTVEQVQREIQNRQIQNIYHLVDFSVERQLTPRWSVSAAVPVLFAYRNQLYAPVGKYNVNALGDATVGVRAWIFRPSTESGDNISVGVSLKIPTGKYNATGNATDRSGKPIIATADQSVQAGDGGTGFAIDIQAYHHTYLSTVLYFSATYLFNPRNTNGVSTFRTAKGEEVMSVTDQYLYRGGLAHAVPKIRGLAASVGGRMEGVPVRDALGASNGFRRPGYAISVEPGLLYGYGKYTLAATAPLAVERNRKISVADYQNHTHGDAAFADFSLIFSVSRRF
jgi:hypothetical protein